MATWRCPHCGTPQVETARCWVCHRSTTACATCRHFGRSVAAQIGFCELDRHRSPLRGHEQRACWEAQPESALRSTARGQEEARRLPGTRPRLVYRLWDEADL